jgi:O-antigen ligase
MRWVLTRESVEGPGFALFDLCNVVVCGAALSLYPALGMWVLAASLIPWAARLLAGLAPFRRTRFDLFVVVYLLTAVSGYWAAYDPPTGAQKLYLIVLSVVLYYALSAQPDENLVWVSALFFCVGVGVAFYFLLTHDFIADPRKVNIANEIGRWLMQVRPSPGWEQIHPNYAAGMVAVMSPFGIYLALWQRNRPVCTWVLAGLAVQALVVFLATSRGVWMAIVCAAGIWLTGWIVRSGRFKPKWRSEAVFPLIVLGFLATVVLLLYAGPASIGGAISGNDSYGTGSRAELFWRSLKLVADFPITGGGLGAFPGLYSQYILGIPNYYLPNAHNTFLDVFIEQGIFGGLAFLTLYLASIWLVARNTSNTETFRLSSFEGLLLVALLVGCVHGMVDDYLYHHAGVLAGLLLPGLAVRYTGAGGFNPFPERLDQTDIMVMSAMSVLILILGVMYANNLRAIWYSNLGAVQMARVELAGFPTNEWAGPRIVEKLPEAESSLLSSVSADPANRTANHRLGLIALLRRDIPSACGYLSAAHALDPAHRGVSKSLGYCYAWQGDLENSKTLLGSLPEAPRELSVYAEWWRAQGYAEFSMNASVLFADLVSP